jgi:hypothetical protein
MERNYRRDWHGEYAFINWLEPAGRRQYTWKAHYTSELMPLIFNVYEKNSDDMKNLIARYPTLKEQVRARQIIDGLNIKVLLKFDEGSQDLRIDWDGMKEEIIEQSIVEEITTVDIETEPTAKELVAKLHERFTLDEHEIREGQTAYGKTTWFVYVRREAIQNRLDDLFPMAWSEDYGHPEINAKFVTVACSIDIRGIKRVYNGEAHPRGKNGEVNGDTVKSAYTDAFKRAASKWGIGLYLQSTPKIQTAEYPDNDWKAKQAAEDNAWNQFVAWYSGKKPQPQQAPPAQPNGDKSQQEFDALPPKFAEAQEQMTIAQTFKVVKPKNGKPYLMLFASRGAHICNAWSTTPFKELGYDVSTWGVEGLYTLTYPVEVYWKKGEKYADFVRLGNMLKLKQTA